ncbi:zinc-binding dehydrogenase [Mycolicibacterium setense]|uniref:zinc-binding dehydrogenase n=1 Tax=Mycolicibacterium setense TaxID=431269 RepID=UPI00057372A3|nr:zinc-binding dehydrogenase [Mycolicibacterium setense]KHO22084.1 dehydrogenase [Mycolicibacterium setense]MCV7113678.1 alcohol dehydrogenase catalytic domain-containing protein [Mycolicibacterium setense]
MRGVVIDTPGEVRVETLPDPQLPGPDGAIVQVLSAAICGSDLHFYDGDYPLFAPIPLGHEAVGTVVETGPGVRSVAVGDQVLVSSVAGCGRCAGCATHDPVTCIDGPRIFGAGALGGAQSELLAVPSADFQLLRVPEGVSTEGALLLTDNLATGWAAARRADFPPGGTVVVIGLGAVGLCAVRAALILGAATVFAVDPVEGRRRRAVRLGATPLQPPALDAVLDATGGRGAVSVIDAVGSDATMNDALSLVRAGGTVSVVGVHDLNPFPFPATLCLTRSITFRGTLAPVQSTWPELVPLLQSGRLDVDGIFTGSMSLADAPAAYAAVAARTADCVKVTLTM